MASVDFHSLCKGASVELDLVDLAALAEGGDVVVDNVRMKAYYVRGQQTFLLVAYLGDVAPEDQVSVIETLLAIQLAAWDQPLVRFGLHPLDEEIVLCVNVALDETMHRHKLAGLMKSVAAQVAQWRRAQLAGKVTFARADAGHAMHA